MDASSYAWRVTDHSVASSTVKGIGLAQLIAEITPARLEDICGTDPGTACRLMLNWTDNSWLAHLADKVVGPIVSIIIIWVVAIILNRIVRLAIKRVGRRIEGAASSGRLEKMRARTPRMLMETGSVGIRAASRAKTTIAVLRSFSTFLIYAIAALYSVSVIGLKVGPLIAGAGIAGVALGFGAQSMVRDFLGGMFMLIEDQYGVGDVIDVASSVDGATGVVGTVEQVNMRMTSIRDVEGTIWHVPNGEIRRVGNMSQGWARALLDIPVPYGTDLEIAKGLIERVAREVTHAPAHWPEVLGEPEIWGVQDLAPDGVLIRLVIKTRPGEQWAIARTLRAELHDAFRAAGIDRPFAQQTVWLHSGDHAGGAVPVGPTAERVRSEDDPTSDTSVDGVTSEGTSER